MIYLFTWNNNYLIKEEALRWKKAFIQKHGKENITQITSLHWITPSVLGETLTSRSIFAEKRLVIIDGFPFSGEKAFSGASDIESFLLKSLDDVPEEILIVFLSVNPDKRKAWYKKLSKIAEIKTFDISWEDQVYHILTKKYWVCIDSSSLRRLIFLKGWDLQKSISEIDKLLVKADSISASDIRDNIMPEFEESIFVFIDTLLSKNSKKIFLELENLISYSNLYAIYQSIVANLRVFLYIELLKFQRKSASEITDILKLWNRSFLINKKHHSHYKSISTLYIELLKFDKNMKLWKLISSDEKDLKRELEQIFLRFVN